MSDALPGAGDVFETIALERHGRVAVLRLDRPQVRNALNRRMVDEMQVAFGRLDLDPEVGAVLLSGNGPSFCSGLDMSEARTQPEIAQAYVSSCLEIWATTWEAEISNKRARPTARASSSR